MQTTIMLELPTSFRKASKKLGITGGQTIQSFINSISIYAFMVRRSGSQCSVASHLFGEYLKSVDEVKSISDPDKRMIGLYYMRRIVRLISSRKSRKEKEAIYDCLISDWYVALLKIN